MPYVVADMNQPASNPDPLATVENAALALHLAQKASTQYRKVGVFYLGRSMDLRCVTRETPKLPPPVAYPILIFEDGVAKPLAEYGKAPFQA